jgi:hypothetical protein
MAAGGPSIEFSRSPLRSPVTRVYALPKPALDLLLDPPDRATAEMDPLREQTRTLQPIDVGEAVTDPVGQLMATDDPHGAGASPSEASRDVR